MEESPVIYNTPHTAPAEKEENVVSAPRNPVTKNNRHSGLN